MAHLEGNISLYWSDTNNNIFKGQDKLKQILCGLYFNRGTWTSLFSITDIWFRILFPFLWFRFQIPDSILKGLPQAEIDRGIQKLKFYLNAKTSW